MAEKRMFAKTIIDSDAFLSLPLSTQALYFHLSMRADDDGFINKPKSIMRSVGANDDDLALLIAKGFIIPFESGIIVIKHWKIHNYIQKDRYKPTVYVEEISTLRIKDNRSYTLDASGQPVYSLEAQSSIDKNRKGKISYADNVYMTKKEYQTLVDTYTDKQATDMIDILNNHKNATGKIYDNDYSAILSWVVDRWNKDNGKKPNTIPQHNNFKQRNKEQDYDKYLEKI